MKHRRLIFGLLASAIAPAAHAQITPESVLRERPQRSANATLTVEVQHETNVARASSATALAQGIEPEDTYVEPALNLSVVQPLGRQTLFVSGGVSYLFHDRNETLDSARANVTGGVGGALGPCGTVLSGSYVQGRTRVDDTALSTSIRNIQKVTSGNAAVTCTRPSGFGVIVQGGLDEARNSQSSQTNGDSQTVRGSLGLRYGRPALGTISINASYSETEYQNRPPGALGPGSFLTRSLGVQFERRLGGRIQANLGVDYTNAEGKNVAPSPSGAPATNGALSDFSGLTYVGDINFRASSRLDARVGFERGVRPTLVTGGSYEIATSIDAAINYRLGTRIALTLNAEQRESSQEGRTAQSVLAIESARTRIAGATLRYKLGRRITFSLMGQHERHDTDNPMFNYRNNIVGLSTEFRY